MIRKSLVLTILLIAVFAALTACAPAAPLPTSEAVVLPPQLATEAPPPEPLRNEPRAAERSKIEPQPDIILAAEPRPTAAPDAAELISLDMLANLTDGGALATGDISFGYLNGQPVAAVVPAAEPAGEESAHTLHIVGLGEAGEPLELASTTLGRGLQIDTVIVSGNQVLLELVSPGPGDLACCPTQLVVQIYQLNGDGLRQMADEVVGSLPGAPPGEIFDRQWILRARLDTWTDLITKINDAQPYLLNLQEDGSYQLTDGCNRSEGSFTADEQGHISFHALAEELVDCEPGSGFDTMRTTLAEADAYLYDEDSFSLIRSDGSIVDIFADRAAAVTGENAEAGEGQEEVRSAVGAQIEDGEIPVVVQPGYVLDLVESGIKLETDSLATSWSWRVRPANSDPADGDGQIYPSHMMLTFDNDDVQGALAEDGRRLLIFPLHNFVGDHEEAGLSDAGDQIRRLQGLIDSAPGRQRPPAGGMPLLPPPGSLVQDWTQFNDLDFEEGRGVRYVSERPTGAGGAATYHYQGMTEDGRYYISLTWPLAARPDEAMLAQLDTMVSTLAVGEQ